MKGPDPEPNPAASTHLNGDSALAEALDRLVDQAAEGDAESLERSLLRTLVGLGLTTAAGVWCRDEALEEWTAVRSFGGTTPPPPVGFTSPECQAFEFCGESLVVVSRAPFGSERETEENEETIDVLVSLTTTLAAACPRQRSGAASPLPNRRDEPSE